MGKVVEFNGVKIPFQEKRLVNLTRMWKAAGSVPRKRPNYWLENKSTQEFVKQIQSETKLPESRLLKSEAGRYGGTYAHWKNGLAYSAFLNPEIHSKEAVALAWPSSKCTYPLWHL